MGKSLDWGWDWDVEESPYFKGIEAVEPLYSTKGKNMDENKESQDLMTVSRALELKYELEDKIFELVEEYENTVGLPVIGIGVLHCEDCDNVESVNVVVELE